MIFAEAMTIWHMPLYKKLWELIDAGKTGTYASNANEEHEEIADWLADGVPALGKVQMIQLNFGSYKEYNMKNRFFNMDLAGGALLDIGVYALSIARSFMESKPDQVLSQVKFAPTGADEQAGILLMNKEAQMATLALSLHSKQRLKVLSDMYDSAKIVPATIEFVDIAGLVKGASKGEGLGNQFLANIREVDAIVHVVRCFEDSNVIHVDGSVDPLRDIETINFELIFSDIEVLDRRISKSARAAHNDKKIAAEVEFLKKVKAHLEDGQLAKTFVTEDEDEQALLSECNLLTDKPVIFAANVSEDDLADDGAENPFVQKVREYAKGCEAEVFVVCAQIEQEIAELDDDEKAMFLEDLGLKESGLEKLIKASYSLLGLISYLTAGPIESKAWTITRGTKAPQAAGKIHSDFERGFIKADVISYQDLIEN